MSLGISMDELDKIEKHRLADPMECFSDMLTYWQKNPTPQSPVNWATLVKVLRSNYVGETNLSYTIQKEKKL